jgi:glycerophosphoryl diester phosphodiesterase
LREWDKRRFLYGHRGASAELPENTLEAFARALELGANALELDVHLTQDAEVVVAHDPDAARMAGDRRSIRDSAWSEVSGWDVGWGFVGPDGSRPFAAKGFRIPRLVEVLEAFPAVRINLDIKQERPSATATVVAALHAAGVEERVLVTSVSASVLAAVRAAGYRGPTGIGRNDVLRLMTTPGVVLERLFPLRGTAAQVPVQVGPIRFDSVRFIAKCHRLGLRVDYWTVNDPAEGRRLLELGADGLMTDVPGAFRDLVY